MEPSGQNNGGQRLAAFVRPAGLEPTRRSGHSCGRIRGHSGSTGRVGVPLLGVVGVMFVCGVVRRRGGGPLARGGRPSGVLEILGRYPIARGQQLVLLRLVSRVVLLHQSRNGLTTLSEVTDSDEVAALLARVEAATRSGPPGRFHGLLARAAAGGDEVGHEMMTNGKVIVDLTRRPRHRVPRSANT